MAYNLIIKNGRIFDPAQNLDIIGDLLISDGKISKTSRSGSMTETSPETTIMDAKNRLVCPGFIDLHCHLREPGFEEKETIATGTKAAARGGYTTVCCMPNTNPPLDTEAGINFVKEKARVESPIRVLPVGCITKGRLGQEIVEMNQLAEAGAVGFSDDGSPVQNSRVMFHAMRYSRNSGLPIIDHCEDKDLSEGGVMHEGEVSAQLGLAGIPAAAEEIIISRDIALAAFTGARLHIAHVSTARSINLIREARRSGINVTAEVTPHHLLLTEQEILRKSAGDILSFNTNSKVSPPLRTREDIMALIAGLKDGTLDAIATDHAPHAQVDKLCEFDRAAFGISNFDTALGCLMSLVNESSIDLMTLISALSFRPAKVLGGAYLNLGTLRPGSTADITIIDPAKEWTVDSKSFISKGKNTPFEGWNLKGKVVATIFAGNVVYRDIQFEK